MSIGPILPGRIPSSLSSGRIIGNLNKANYAMVFLQDQIATGNKFFLPSESPSDAVSTISLQRLIERKSQMQNNVRDNQVLLDQTEQSIASVAETLNRANTFVLGAIGDSATDAERTAMATEVSTLIQSLVAVGNSNYQGRFLFGGSESTEPPFEAVDGGFVRYNGDKTEINAFVDFSFLLPNNINGADAFNALSPSVSTDADPALTLQTKISDLHNGSGVNLGSIQVAITGPPSQTETIDLTNAETINDIKIIIEDAFSGALPNITVDIDPGSNNGIRITPSAGTVAVTDQEGSRAAFGLGIESTAAAVVNGTDIDPQITLKTNLADLNNGAGIGATAGNGLKITNGLKSQVVDISSATTVEDLFNVLEAADLDLYIDLNDDRTGISISSRLSGADFSIGENNGTNATGLGIRTYSGNTVLADLNLGQGADVDGDEDLELTLSDGTAISIDLAGAKTIQDVIDAITASDPNITASLNTVGNGITLTDASGGASAWGIQENNLSAALGLDNATVPAGNTLVGEDNNPLQAQGGFALLTRLQSALLNGDDAELNLLGGAFTAEIERFSLVRTELGGRSKVIAETSERLKDDQVSLNAQLSDVYHVDLTEAATRLTQLNATIQATLQVASITLNLSIFNFL